MGVWYSHCPYAAAALASANWLAISFAMRAEIVFKYLYGPSFLRSNRSWGKLACAAGSIVGATTAA
jgi:hypothetical protein